MLWRNRQSLFLSSVEGDEVLLSVSNSLKAMVVIYLGCTQSGQASPELVLADDLNGTAGDSIRPSLWRVPPSGPGAFYGFTAVQIFQGDIPTNDSTGSLSQSEQDGVLLAWRNNSRASPLTSLPEPHALLLFVIGLGFVVPRGGFHNRQSA